MKHTIKTAIALCAFFLVSGHALAAEVCTVSMMGRVCYEEGSPELTATHMKGDAVAESTAAKKKTDVADASKVKK
ncbi:MAG TPA: hypothetical protein VK958_08195 [Methylophilus sp.]|uniref:hypothetical protein n=1 Tax=Methylophilus sp. TaxID=29541 RepID=UPI002B9D92F4|nr:hypothetical protein [Methylophilus sp.]HSH87211.1 hypothetical protein [Methylophilus sp.]